MSATTHHITVNGHIYEFMMVPASSSGYMVHAPGLVPFGANNLSEARDILRSAYTPMVEGGLMDRGF